MLKYTAPFSDSSGYANAARNYIRAMARAGINLTAAGIAFERQRTSHHQNDLINTYINRKCDYKINLVHCTPENWPRLKEHNKYNIGYTAWETDKLPTEWVPLINQMDEVWIPSSWNKEVLLNSGITIPIAVIPHALDEASMKIKIDNNFGLPEDKYKFYSIFQWTERKNPECLLKAFWEEFNTRDNVTLVLKTYNMGWTLDQQNLIRNKILSIKATIKNPDPAPILYVGDLMDDNTIYSLHNACDSFVLPHRGEGFGLPIAEAMYFEKPVITTNWSGNLDFTTEENSYLIKSTLTPVGGMPWGKYTPDQNWANPDQTHLQKLMRYVLNNKEEAAIKGALGKKKIEQITSYDYVGNLIKSRLESLL